MFCVICLEDSEIWSPINFSDMFKCRLINNKNKNEKWISINIINNENLPDDIFNYSGVVLTGSRFNICDREQYSWFNKICEFIREAERIGKPKIYGGCFGCQLIGYALGGEVERNPTNRFILKAENIIPIQPYFNEFFENGRIQQHQQEQEQETKEEETKESNKIFNIIVSHGYCVSILPPNSTLIGTSSSCCNEIFVCGRYQNLLACQSHPEFEYEYAIRDRIWPRVIEQKRLNDEEIELSSKSFEELNPNDSILFCNLISTFLHSDGNSDDNPILPSTCNEENS